MQRAHSHKHIIHLQRTTYTHHTSTTQIMTAHATQHHANTLTRAYAHATQRNTTHHAGVCVPLCVSHPETELKYVIDDSKASLVMAHGAYNDIASKVQAAYVSVLLSSHVHTHTPIHTRKHTRNEHTRNKHTRKHTRAHSHMRTHTLPMCDTRLHKARKFIFCLPFSRWPKSAELPTASW
jgi:hypothetical protein